MAINTYGVGPTITAQKWAELFYRAAEGGGGEYVTGFSASVASGTRKVTIGGGTAAAVGCLVESDEPVTVTLENAGANRRDIICLQIDWTNMSAPGSIVVKKGWSGNALPSLTQDAGVLWQVPLAVVDLSAGVGQLDGSDVTDWRPTRRQVQVYRPHVPNVTGVGRTLLVARTIPYPGYDYRLRMSATVNFAYRESSYTSIWIGMEGQRLVEARGADSNQSPAVIPSYTTGRLTDETTIRLHMRAQGSGAAGAQSYASYSNFEIVQEPF